MIDVMSGEKFVSDADLDTGIDPSAGVDEKDDDAPVYDERGNVRPRGTEGARHMTYEERVEIATRIAAGGDVVDPEQPVPPKRGRARKK